MVLAVLCNGTNAVKILRQGCLCNTWHFCDWALGGMLTFLLCFFCSSLHLYGCIKTVSPVPSLQNFKNTLDWKKEEEASRRNYPPHFVNMHKTALKIAQDFITLSPKSQHAIKALLYLWKIHKSCFGVFSLRWRYKNAWGADRRVPYKFYWVHENASTQVFKKLNQTVLINMATVSLSLSDYLTTLAEASHTQQFKG